jgi:hypothetical protein
MRPMAEWKNEDDIKAELRFLTGELKQLRQELRAMVSPPKPNPSRSFLHRQAWPPTPPATADEKPPPPPKRRKGKTR